jgi:hypothetical protein
MDRHPLDQYEEDAKKSKEEFMKKALLDSSLVFQVFSTQAGAKLLDRWKQILMDSPTARPGDDQISIGMAEGQKTFIRTIIYAVKQHEEAQ